MNNVFVRYNTCLQAEGNQTTGGFEIKQRNINIKNTVRKQLI